jgi:hypothetical protein
MKKLFASTILVVLCNCSYAQKDSTGLDLGMNIIRLTNFLGFADNTTDYEEWNPYMFTAGYNAKRLHVRYGLGYNSIYRIEQPTQANGQSSFDTTSKIIDMRFGLGMQFKLAPKWVLKCGVDFFIANRFTSTEAKFKDSNGNMIENLREITYKEKGGAPFLFVQYNVTSRVSLGTELLWRMSSYTLSDSDRSNGSSIEINKQYAGAKRFIMAPTALFVQFRF